MVATRKSNSDVTLRAAYSVLESMLSGDFRHQFINELMESGEPSKAVKNLRYCMNSHSFETKSNRFSLENIVGTLDDRTREEGFEVMHSWNHSDHTFSTENTPVLLAEHFSSMSMIDQNVRTCLFLLLDVYFFHVLALCSMRAWDDDRPQDNFHAITELLDRLQGSEGSGHQFVENAETLLVIAVSQYHPIDQAYDDLIEKIWSLDHELQVRFSLISSAVLGGHLRWGFRAMYGRDIVKMRADNVGDYPWLLYSVNTLMEEYVRLKDCGMENRDRREVVRALLNGLSPDPWAFFQTLLPNSLVSYKEKHAGLKELFREHGRDLALDFAECRSIEEIYSPLALHFNFPHNIMNAILMTCLSEGSVEGLSINDLLTGNRCDSLIEERSKQLASKLMTFAGNNRDRVGPQGAKLIVYDQNVALAHCNMVLSTMEKHLR